MGFFASVTFVFDMLSLEQGSQHQTLLRKLEFLKKATFNSHWSVFVNDFIFNMSSQKFDSLLNGIYLTSLIMTIIAFLKPNHIIISLIQGSGQLADPRPAIFCETFWFLQIFLYMYVVHIRKIFKKFRFRPLVDIGLMWD